MSLSGRMTDRSSMENRSKVDLHIVINKFHLVFERWLVQKVINSFV